MVGLLRIFKMIATSGFLTALECTKLVFGRGSVRRRGKKHRLLVEVESLASWKKLWRVDVKA